jgi:hypothetical protein
MLVRLDRQSGTVRTAGPFPEASDLALAGGHLWVATGGPNASGKQQAVSLLRLDPTTLTVQQRVEMPALEVAGPVGPVIDGRGDALWMGAGQQLVRLDAGTGAPVATVDLGAGSRSVSLSVDPSVFVLYVGTAGNLAGTTVTEWAAHSGSLLASAKTFGGDLGGPHVSATANGVWISFATGLHGGIEFLRRDDLTALRAPPGPLVPSQEHTNAVTVSVGGGVLWVTDGVGRLDCSSLSTGAVLASAATSGGPGTVVADASGVYLGDQGGLHVLRPDPRCRT